MSQKKKLISKLGEKLRSLLNQESIEDLAKEKKFVQRTSSLTGFKFAMVNIRSLGSDGFSSLTELCLKLYEEEGIKISKQGLDSRYKEESTAFLKSLFLKLLKLRLDTQIDLGHLSIFSGIYVRDATSSQLPPFFPLLSKVQGGALRNRA
ncbi:MAG: hypothetical protein AB8B69_09690 [Chitinophagales bacterium]